MDTAGHADEPNEKSPASSNGVWTQHSTRSISGLTVGALLIGTVMYRQLEDWGWVDSFYFTVMTLTTVGYGDFSPTTPVSKLFTVVYVIGGISLIGAFLNEVMKRRERKIEALLTLPWVPARA